MQVCQCTQTANYFSIIIAIADLFLVKFIAIADLFLVKFIAIADLFLVKYVGLALSMTSHPLAGVHFRDTSEHFHLTGTHFVLHPQLISCIQGQLYQATFRPSVPLSMIVCH